MNGVECSNDGVTLLKCPFCGGEVYLKECMGLNNKPNYFVECGGMECDVIPYTNMFDTIEEAINAWNTRKPLERVVERLEELVKKYHEEYEIDMLWGVKEAIEIIKEEGLK